MNVNSIHVIGKEEGELLIHHLKENEVWVTPFVIESNGLFFVKAGISVKELFLALSHIRGNN